MKKISKGLENRIIIILQNNNSIGRIAKMTSVSKSTVFEVWKPNNLQAFVNSGGRPKMSPDHGARHMERLLRKSSTLTHKKAPQAINKPTSKWTARRA